MADMADQPVEEVTATEAEPEPTEEVADAPGAGEAKPDDQIKP